MAASGGCNLPPLLLLQGKSLETTTSVCWHPRRACLVYKGADVSPTHMSWYLVYLVHLLAGKVASGPHKHIHTSFFLSLPRVIRMHGS